MGDPRVLAEIEPFRGLSPSELSRLSGLLHFKSYPAGTPIINEELPGEVAYFILGGAVRIQSDQSDGSYVILAILGPGDIVGEMSLLDHLNRSATAVTQEDSTLLWIDRAAFWDCLRSMPIIGYNLTGILSRRLRLANAQIQSLATLDVYGRVARQLLTFAHVYGRETSAGVLIPFRLPQSDLAGLVGASRVRVNHVLVAYKRRKFLSVDRDYRITLHDLEALAQRCK